MIKKENFKNVLEKLGFENKSDIYIKNFNEFKTKLKVDFKNEKLIYPEDDGLKVNDKTTSNFTSAENFVVFECVCRLLNQGYNPKHIELEPKWQVGHGASGGKADILIKDNDNRTLLIIECKTAGDEFKKAWDVTQIKPTQLFSYAQQDRDTKFIALYASDFVDDEIKSDYYLISLSDDKKKLFEDKSLKSYKEASTVKTIYDVWSRTYRKEFKKNGIFEENKAYFIGVEKTNINDLKIVSSNDIKGKYNEFATIMRQHNIGGAERAFNVLVNLFLCKIIDENKNIKNDKNGLEFYWKGISYDDAFSLQDRLQELYKIGMFDFLNEEITYISDKAIDDMFKIVDLDSLKIDVKSKFREQKFFTNNDFSFLDVHSEELFYKNFEVLLKVVEMFQDIRLTGVEDNQFLGDMFEGFLDNGVKQSEGQFFTPMPIVKFIINSLPLEQIQKTHKTPKAIDFACGAGHFLNEVAKIFTSNEVVGIEKEYRLSKVAKVSALMYGQENINIVYNDALTQDKKILPNSFSVLVANPPYSVKGFLETLSKEDIETYELTKTIEEKSFTANNSIECFFIEKAKQILCADAVVGIVLPSSILSKGDGQNTYVGTREILIKYFEIIAIAEFGSGTFGKTGTNTVTLFLKRRDDTQNIVARYKDFVDNLFIYHKNRQNLFKNKNIIEDYCTHIDMEQEIYLSMFENELNQEIFKHETFSEYKAEFEKSTLTKNRKTKASYKELTKEEKEKKEAVELLKYIKNIESDKLYYFCLASETNKEVLIIKAPSNGKENKKFLGYEWSGRKGNEGIQYSGGTLNNINTPLFNPNDKHDETKINSLISKNFSEDNIEIPQELEKFVSKARLVDMLDFSRRDFNKAFLLSPKRKMKIKSKWQQKKLGTIAPYVTNKINISIIENKNYITTDNILQNRKGVTDYKGLLNTERITEYKKDDILISNIRPYLKKIWFADKDAGCSNDVLVFRSINPTTILPKYLFYLLSSDTFFDYVMSSKKGIKMPRGDKEQILQFPIPLADIKIQEKIVKECEIVDKDVEKANETIQLSKDKIIKHLTAPSANELVKLGDACDMKAGKFVSASNINDEYAQDLYPCYGGNGLRGYVETFTHNGTYPIIGRQGALCGNVMLAKNKFHATEHAVVVIPKIELDIIWLYHTLVIMDLNKYKTGVAQPGLSVKNLNVIEIEIPSLKIQKEIVSKIEKLEIEITKSQKIIDKSSDKKQAILKKYL